MKDDICPHENTYKTEWSWDPDEWVDYKGAWRRDIFCNDCGAFRGFDLTNHGEPDNEPDN
jgi:hypothetical protein